MKLLLNVQASRIPSNIDSFSNEPIFLKQIFSLYFRFLKFPRHIFHEGNYIPLEEKKRTLIVSSKKQFLKVGIENQSLQ